TPQEIQSGFKSGRFSLAWNLFPTEVESLRREREFATRYRETPRLSTYYVVMNAQEGPLSNLQLRRQFMQCIDVDDVIRRNIGRLAMPAHTLIPPGLLGYASSRREHTLAVELPEPLQLQGMAHSMFDGPYSPLLQDLLSV